MGIPGHMPSVPAHSEFLPRSTHEWQVSGDEFEPQFGWTRPQAGVQQWPVKDGLIRRVAVEQRTELPIEHCPNCGARELKIIATILERLVIEKILTHLRLDPKPPPIGRKREAQARETDRRKPVG